MSKVLVLYYSTCGHIETMAQAVRVSERPVPSSWKVRTTKACWRHKPPTGCLTADPANALHGHRSEHWRWAHPLETEMVKRFLPVHLTAGFHSSSKEKS